MTSSILCALELIAHRQPATKIAHWDSLCMSELVIISQNFTNFDIFVSPHRLDKKNQNRLESPFLTLSLKKRCITSVSLSEKSIIKSAYPSSPHLKEKYEICLLYLLLGC